ncbi:MAG: hypothetical protein C5B43_02230 [Verrucomicrobia bacterium]|nr:MAG: hypothetical protein C5B43_02230 [Verrucomicrobiota bacterium]
MGKMYKRIVKAIFFIYSNYGLLFLDFQKTEGAIMNKEEIVKNYLNHLANGNYQSIINLFAEDALVLSPLYGPMNPVSFYKELFSDTSKSTTTLKTIFTSASQPNIAAAYFLYDWTKKDGSVVSFECVDVFTFDDDNKITKLSIIYDTYQTRIKFDKLKHL